MGEGSNNNLKKDLQEIPLLGFRLQMRTSLLPSLKMQVSNKERKEATSVNALLDKHMTDDSNYKSYTDLSKEDTKELAEAVTKLGEPLSQMGVILDGK